jgi:hypothetical protein
MIYAIKAEIADGNASSWTFSRQKTMYGGKRIAEGDVIFLFASENEGGQGLIARGVVTGAKAIPLRHPESETTFSHHREAEAGLMKITAEEVISAARHLLGASHA